MNGKNLNRADVLAFVSLFIICITWHIRPDIRALWDDILRLDFTSNSSFFEHFKKLLVTSVLAKYRPVAEIVVGLNYEFSRFRVEIFSILHVVFHAANVCFLYRILVYLTGGNRFAAWISATLFGISSFHIFNLIQFYGADELFCLLCILGIISAALSFQETKREGYVWAMLVTNLLLTFTYERFVVLFPFILYVIWKEETFTQKKRMQLAAATVFPAAAYFVIINFVFGYAFFLGTDREPMITVANIGRVFDFAWCAILAAFGLST